MFVQDGDIALLLTDWLIIGQNAGQIRTRYNINIPKQVIIYFFIGIIIALSILFIIFYFDRTIKSVEQVEQKIKLPILGGVEEYKKGGKRK